MAYDHPLTTAVDTAWTVYRATHEGVEESDSRRCLLARYLNGTPEAREGNVEELASLGLAYLARLQDEC
jgi:hypothetical protein